MAEASEVPTVFVRETASAAECMYTFGPTPVLAGPFLVQEIGSLVHEDLTLRCLRISTEWAGGVDLNRQVCVKR